MQTLSVQAVMSYRPYDPAFMSRIALQACANPGATGELAGRYGISETLVCAWRTQLENAAVHMFSMPFVEPCMESAPCANKLSDLYSAVLDEMGISIAVLEGPDLRYRYANLAYRSQAPEPDLIGRRLREVFPVSTTDGVESGLLNVLRTGQPWEVRDFVAQVPGLENSLWEGKITRLSNYEGETAAVLICIQDVTAKAKIEKSLRQKVALLQAISENSTDVMFAKDRDGHMLYVNPAALDLIGKPVNEVLGKTDAEFLDDKNAANSVMKNDQQIMETGKAAEVEETVPLPDGTHRIWLSQKRPYLNEDGSVIGLLGVSRDITERKGYEDAVREAHDRLQRVLGSITDGLAVLDRSWHYTYFSETGANMLGICREDMLGKYFWDLFPHAEHLVFGREYRSAMETGRPTHFEEFYPEPLNKWVECHCYPSADGLSVYFRDVTDRRKAQDAANESRRRIDAMLDATPVGLAYAEASGRVGVMNGEAKRIWGSPPEAASVAEYAPFKGWWADQSEKHGRPLDIREWPTARALQGERVLDVVLEIEPFDALGTRRLVLHRSVPIFGEDGDIIGAVTAMTDITESAQMKRALVESNHQILQLANTIPQLAWMADPNGEVHWFNERWFEYTGRNLSEMVGWGWSSAHDPDVLPQVLERWNQSLEYSTAFEMTFPLRGKDGIFRPFYTLAEPLKNLDGNVVKWFGTCTDVSALQRTQEDLTKTQHWLQEGLETGKMVAWEWDLESDAIRYSDNAVDVLGYGQSTYDAALNTIYEDDRATHQAAVDRAIQEVSEVDQVTRRVRPDNGNMIWLRSKGNVLVRADGVPYGIRGILIDITEQVMREQALNEASNRKDEFLAMLAHELRNPLAPISTAAQLLMMSSTDARRVKSTAEIIARQIGHMTHLIDDLLDVSRVTRGLVDLDLELVSIKDIVNIAVEQARPLIEAREHELTLHIVSTPAVVLGDRVRLCQVVVNLLNNAAKYTPQAGKIFMDITVNAGEVCIAVEDNGIGIDSQLLPHVFELFTQATRTPDRTQGGLGLGLAVVDSLIRMHGGRVEASSAGTGKGSRFAIVLPALAEPNNKKDASSTRQTPASLEEGHLSIMVVDDNCDAADVLSDILRLQGHVVQVEYSSNAALATAQESLHDLYLLDIGLPDFDGYELAQRLRAMPGNAHAVFVAVTGYGQAHDKVLSQAAGFDHHLVKPIDIAHLDDITSSVMHLNNPGG